jgi:ABC-type glycerol-3-phosphate transport system substrate-binding protein
MTPFDDMVRLIEAEAIEPWSKHVPHDVVADIHPAVRGENTFGGQLYGWPFLVDITVQGWNSELVERAGLDPGRPPSTWDEYIDNARTVVRLGAAPYGCTFDAHSWRSLVPIAYTFSTDVYTDDGLFDYTHEAVVHALEVLRRMFELANPDVLDPHVTAGAGLTTDEGAFAAQLAAYYVKFGNAHIRAANTWPDPSRLALAALPLAPGGSGATVFWTTAIALARYGNGSSKEMAAEYAKALTYDETVWRESIGSGRQSSGQLPAVRSLWRHWRTEQPPWVPDWASQTFEQLRHAAPIRPHRLGSHQFTVGQPYIERYLTREETNPRRALRAAQTAVRKASD